MAVYAFYSYEIQEGNRSLFYKNTGKKAIDMANEIIGNLLNDGLTVIGKKKNEDQPLTNRHFIGREGVFAWELCNVKDKNLREGHDKIPHEEHPGSVIFGYGDELDEDYKKLQERNENECLRHMKSIRYLESTNYRRVLEFIDSVTQIELESLY